MWNRYSVGQAGQAIAQAFGLRLTSHYRDPQRNARVGGARRSDHLWGGAVDLAGDPSRMAAAARWAQQFTGPNGPFRIVLHAGNDSGHGDHVHLSWNQGSAAPLTLPTGVSLAPDPSGAGVVSTQSAAGGTQMGAPQAPSLQPEIQAQVNQLKKQNDQAESRLKEQEAHRQRVLQAMKVMQSRPQTTAVMPEFRLPQAQTQQQRRQQPTVRDFTPGVARRVPTGGPGTSGRSLQEITGLQLPQKHKRRTAEELLRGLKAV